MPLKFLSATPGRPLMKIISTTGTTFTVAPSEDHTDDSWTKYDLYDGEFGFATADQKIFARLSGTVVQVYPATSSGGTGVRLNEILAANGTNTIDSTLYAQEWGWSTLSTQTAFKLTANAISTGSLLALSSTSTAGDASKLLQLTRSGANAGSGKKNYAFSASITNTGTSSTNVAGYFSASGGSTNYAIETDSLIYVHRDSIGTTATDGILIANNTAAAAGSQQYSPSVHLRGYGWKTDAVAASRVVDYSTYVIPIQTTDNPASEYTITSSINNGASSKVLIIGNAGGLITGGNILTGPTVNGSSGHLKNIAVVGGTNTIAANVYATHTMHVFGSGNSITHSASAVSMTYGNSNTNNNAFIYGNSNVTTSGAGSYVYGSGNTVNNATYNAYVYGKDNTGYGAFCLGANNTLAGNSGGTNWSVLIGANNSVDGSGGYSSTTSGQFIAGWYNTDNVSNVNGGGRTIFGTGITMSSSFYNNGTFNFGYNSGTGNRPALQFRSSADQAQYGWSVFNQLLQGVDTTATSFDPVASNVYVLKEATTLSGTGTITGTTNQAGVAAFTMSAGISGMTTGEEVVITGTTSYNGTYYVYMDTATSFRIATTRANALAATPLVAYSTADATGTVNPKRRITRQVASDTVVYYVKSIAAGQASPHWITEDLGTYAIGTARVGWRSNTNLVLCSNDTARLTITTLGSVLTAVAGAIATNATDGFLYIPTCAGTPTGTPTAQTGMRAMVWDSTNYKLYVYDNSTWNAMN